MNSLVFRHSPRRHLLQLLIICLLATGSLQAQNGDPTPLDLNDYPQNLNNVLVQPGIEQSRFVLGWNWGGRPPRVFSEDLLMNTFHGGGAGAYLGLVPGHNDDALPGMDLIWVSEKVITANGNTWTGIGGRNGDRILLQAQALHFSPLPDIALTQSGAIDDFSVYETPANGPDRSGGAFGFLERNHGAREWLSQAGRYTFALRRPGGGPITWINKVLAQPWPNDELFNNDDGGLADDPDYNGSRMYVSINLRRLDGDADAQNPNEPILRLRLPYQLADGSSPLNGVISFLEGPTDNSNFHEINFNNRFRGMYKDLAPMSGTEIIITSNMLPKVNGTVDSRRDITISAYFELNSASNKLLQKEPFFDPTLNRIHKLDIEVDYMPNVDIGINWIRFETPHAQRLFRGEYDALIEEEIEKDLTLVDAYVESDSEHDVQISRFYGIDEPTRSLWWAQRYFNKLVDGRAASELSTSVTTSGSDLDDTRIYYPLYQHMVEARENWGEGDFRLSQINAAPYILNGKYGGGGPEFMEFSGDFSYRGYRPAGQAVDDPDDPEFQTHHETYAFFDDDNNPGTNNWHLPPIDSDEIYKGLVNTWPKSFQLAVESRIFYAYHRGGEFLFNHDADWWINPWAHSEWLLPHPDPLLYPPPVYPKLAINHRPKTGEELRLFLWLPVILGAKGIMHYKGTSGPPIYSLPNKANPYHVGYTNREDLTPAEQQQYSISNDDLLGGDFIDLDNSDGVFDYTELDKQVTNPLLVASSLLCEENESCSHTKLYIGRRSTRIEAQRLHKWITGPSHVPAVEGATVGDVLMKLKLRAWLDFGYRGTPLETQASPADMTQLKGLIDVANVRARHMDDTIDDVVNNQSVADDRFIDITMLEHDEPATQDVCYVGVVNRIVNPTLKTDATLLTNDPMVLSNEANATPVYFLSTAQFDAEVANNVLIDEYDQAGSRIIEIPFIDGEEFVVEEVGRIADPDFTDGILTLTMKPGEGKLLRIRKIAPPVDCCELISIAPAGTNYQNDCCVDMTIDFDPTLPAVCNVYSIGLSASGAGFNSPTIDHANWEASLAVGNEARFDLVGGASPDLEQISFSFCRANSSDRPVVVNLFGEHGNLICSESFDLVCAEECCERIETQTLRRADEPGVCVWDVFVRLPVDLCTNNGINEITIEAPPFALPPEVYVGTVTLTPSQNWLHVGLIRSSSDAVYEVVMSDAQGQEICRKDVEVFCEPVCCPIVNAGTGVVSYINGDCCFDILVNQDPLDGCDIGSIDIYDENPASPIEALLGTFSGAAPGDYRMQPGAVNIFNVCTPQGSLRQIRLVYRDVNGRELCQSPIIDVDCNVGNPPGSGSGKAGFNVGTPAAEYFLAAAPNPSSGATTISYILSEESLVTLTLVDLMGRELDLMVSARQSAGAHALNYDASDLAVGLYYLQLRVNDTLVNQTLTIHR